MSQVRVGLALVLLSFAFATACAAQELRICPTCNKTYPAGAQFCQDDGTKLVPKGEKCPKCQALRAGKARFCSGCGYDYQKPAPTQPGAAERSCSKCNRKAPAGMKFCAGCGATLPAEVAGSGSPAHADVPVSGELRQWADAVPAFSSQMGAGNFSAQQIVGPPDVQRGGRDGKAWTPMLSKRGVEWITVHFPRRVVPRAVRIYETSAGGFVTRIHAVTGDGREVLFWEAEDRLSNGQQILEAVSTEYVGWVDTLKITVDTKKIRGWTEIDAVELIGSATGDTPGGGRRDGPERSAPKPVDPREGRDYREDPPAETDRPIRSGLDPYFATPDDCFDAWKDAVLRRDTRALAACYVVSDRAGIEQDSVVADAIFDRYTDALRRDQYAVESRREEGGQPVWVISLRVRETNWSRQTRETFRFLREQGGWKLRIDRGQ